MNINTPVIHTNIDSTSIPVKRVATLDKIIAVALCILIFPLCFSSFRAWIKELWHRKIEVISPPSDQAAETNSLSTNNLEEINREDSQPESSGEGFSAGFFKTIRHIGTVVSNIWPISYGERVCSNIYHKVVGFFSNNAAQSLSRAEENQSSNEIGASPTANSVLEEPNQTIPGIEVVYNSEDFAQNRLDFLNYLRGRSLAPVAGFLEIILPQIRSFQLRDDGRFSLQLCFSENKSILDLKPMLLARGFLRMGGQNSEAFHYRVMFSQGGITGRITDTGMEEVNSILCQEVSSESPIPMNEYSSLCIENGSLVARGSVGIFPLPPLQFKNFITPQWISMYEINEEMRKLEDKAHNN